MFTLLIALICLIFGFFAGVRVMNTLRGTMWRR